MSSFSIMNRIDKMNIFEKFFELIELWKHIIIYLSSSSEILLIKFLTPMMSNQLTLDNFNMLSVIGKGSYAKVVLVKKKG